MLMDFFASHKKIKWGLQRTHATLLALVNQEDVLPGDPLKDQSVRVQSLAAW